MTKKQWLLAFVLADFSALNAYVLSQYGIVELYQLITANAVGVLVLVDLTIALSLVMIWMVNDARDRGISALPYIGITLLLGSIGPLVYLLRTSGSEAVDTAPLTARLTTK